MRETKRQTERQTDREADRQAGRGRELERIRYERFKGRQ